MPGESVPDPSPDDPAEQAIRAALANGLMRLVEAHPTALAGSEEGVHRMRTTARRLRSTLRAFRPLLDEGWARNLEAEFKWLADALGKVRDLDVQRGRLRAAAGELVEALNPLLAALAARHGAARLELADTLRSDRCSDLLRRLAEAANAPATAEGAAGPCRSALPPLAARPWKKLKAAGRGLSPDDPDESFHETRIRAKRARYTAEVIAPFLGHLKPKAERFARRAAAVQEVLGEHQDAVVSRSLLEDIVAERPQDVPFAVAAGRMIERQVVAAEAARGQFQEAWARLDRGKILRWLRPKE